MSMSQPMGVIPNTQAGIPIQPPSQQVQQNQSDPYSAFQQYNNNSNTNYGGGPGLGPRHPNIDGAIISLLPQNQHKGDKTSLFGEKALIPETVGIRRGTLNWIPFIIGMTLPWLLFTASLSLNAFLFRDVYPTLLDILNTLAIVTAFLYIYIVRKKRQAYDVKFVIGIMCFTYLCAGWVIGSIMYWFRMHPYYQLSGMATYHGVNPSRFKRLIMTSKDKEGTVNGNSNVGISSVNKGEKFQFHLEDAGRKAESKRYQDAAIIYFDTPTVTVDVDKTMSFKDGNTYCVAPIIDTACTDSCGYDFWAVGINCCGTDGEVTFTCDLQGDIPGSPMRSGVRWVEPTSRAFYRLAVTEAESVHHLESPQPLFFTFYSRGENPHEVVADLARSAYRRLFTYSLLSFFGNMIFMAYVARKLVFGPKARKRLAAVRNTPIG